MLNLLPIYMKKRFDNIQPMTSVKLLMCLIAPDIAHLNTKL